MVQLAQTKEPARGHLLKILGFTFGLAVIVGGTIGAGILRSPGSIAAELPNQWWFIGVWLIGGAYALLGAISLSELGAMLPKSGGQYVFVRHALGDYAGFVAGWADWVSTCGSAAAVSLVIAGFSIALFPQFAGSETLIATVITLCFVLLQWRGIDWGSTTQNITSLLKAVAFAVLIVGAIWASSASPAAPPSQSHGFLLALTLSLQSVIYTYDGWTGVIYFSEEVKDPGKDIPRAMIGGVLGVIAIYLLLNVALLATVPMAEFAGKDFAVGIAAQKIFGRYGDTVFRVLTIVSMLSAVNAFHLMASRVLFGVSRDRLFAGKAAEVNKGGTPGVALWIGAAVVLMFIVFGQTFERVIAVLSFFFVGTYVLSFVSVFVLRKREPERPRPYRAWGYPWTTGICLIVSVLFLLAAIASDTQTSLYSLGLLAVSYPAFWLTKRLTID